MVSEGSFVNQEIPSTSLTCSEATSVKTVRTHTVLCTQLLEDTTEVLRRNSEVRQKEYQCFGILLRALVETGEF